MDTFIKQKLIIQKIFLSRIYSYFFFIKLHLNGRLGEICISLLNASMKISLQLVMHLYKEHQISSADLEQEKKAM